MQPEDILDFWFEGVKDEDVIEKNVPPYANWFRISDDFDQNLKEKFTAFWQDAFEGRYDDWGQALSGRLALIICFDQFTRNLFRKTPKMYCADLKALQLAKEGCASGTDKNLSLIQRVFFYMPLMHAQDLTAQKLSVDLFTALLEDVRRVYPQNAAYYQSHLNHAKGNLTIIQKHGEFPQRAKVKHA